MSPTKCIAVSSRLPVVRMLGIIIDGEAPHSHPIQSAQAPIIA
jgi:hypothetical protein